MKGRILAVDDERHQRDILQMILNAEGYEIIGVAGPDLENGQIAERSLLSGDIEIDEPPDVYLPFQIDPNSITQSQMTLNRNPTSWASNLVGFERIINYNGETNVITPVVTYMTTCVMASMCIRTGRITSGHHPMLYGHSSIASHHSTHTRHG